MKKNYLLLLLLISGSVFSQATRSKIQTYLNTNLTKLELTSTDVNDWIIESEATSESTNIHNYYLKQRHQGIEIFNAVANVWVKNDEVINIHNQFVPNIASKVNTTTPTLSVLEGLFSAKSLLNITSPNTNTILETKEFKNFRISNNSEDEITAELVYQLTQDNQLRLAWDYVIDIPGHQHLWHVRIDAVDGKILEKNDMVISCAFGENHNHGASCSVLKETAASVNLFKETTSSLLEVQSGSYRVIPYNYESPNHIARQLITNPHNVVASPFGWHDTNGVVGNEFTITRGNNVHAQDDLDGNNGTGTSPNGGASLNFDFPYGGTSTQPSTYLSAATTNLFYMNNMMHDVWYQYGFNEVNGNFQRNNYGKGGVTNAFGDPVNADAQDGASLNPQNLNNANFSTPVDGQSPRMQMFLWNVAAPIEPIFINTPVDFSGPRQARDNAFSPGNVPIPIAPAIIQSNFVLYDDGTPDVGQTDNADGCGPAVNAAAISGKITVIRRSTSEANGGAPCAFIEKVKNAQNAGATAVIIVNNVPGVISMSGADATVTIPAVSVTQEVGEALIARMKLETVNGKIQLGEAPFINADGDFDNGIIAHEYGHGISTRLAGGPGNSSCLSNYEAMGEGWSDWFALMMQLKSGDVGTTPKGIATFSLSQPTTGSGLRSYQYSTDMSVNPLTFADSNEPIPTEPTNTGYRYVIGDFWATVLWDLNWAYIQKYGFDSNVYTGTGGNNKVMRLVLDAIKLQPCNPGIVAGRDALIAADQATTGGQDYCLITEVFRRRGVGLGASSGSNNNSGDQVESFVAFPAGPNCTALNTDSFEKEDLFKVYPNPTNGLLNIRINNFTGKASINVIDINGRTVYSNVNSDFNVESSINLNNLSSGMYIIKVTADTTTYTEKVLIK